MNRTEQARALASAVSAARAAGQMMRANLHSAKRVNSTTQHDIKLELDVRCQQRIEKTLRRDWPAVAILGEEGVLGDPQAAHRWVVDPIDGTVNFSYGIPHACVSIALQARKPARPGSPAPAHPDLAYDTLVGVVYDPFVEELWTAVRGQPARLNGRTIRASRRQKLQETIIHIGFAKHAATVRKMLPALNHLIPRTRKIRIMGSAALALVYVASGRTDAYLEWGLRLWDIAAGGLILECAGGEFWREPVAGKHTFRIIANNGRLRRQLERFV